MNFYNDCITWFEDAGVNYGAIPRNFMQKNKWYLKQNGISVFMEFSSKEKFSAFITHAKETFPDWKRFKVFSIDTNNPTQQNVWRRFIR